MVTQNETQAKRTLAQQIGAGVISKDEWIAKAQELFATREWRVIGTQANGFPIDKVVNAPTAGIAALWCEFEGSFIVSVRAI